MPEVVVGQDEMYTRRDRLETDILMGQRAGAATALVLTGVTGRDQLDGSAIQPDYVLENVGQVLKSVVSGQ